MSRTLLLATILMLALRLLFLSPVASAQTPEPQESGGRFYLTIVGDVPPNQVFGLSFGLCNEECPAVENVQLFCALDDPCRSGETFEMLVDSGSSIEFQYFRGTVTDENDSNEAFGPRDPEYFYGSGGLVPLDRNYSTTYTYPSANPPMPEAPPEVGGGGMSERLKPTASPVRWGGGGGSSIAHRR